MFALLSGVDLNTCHTTNYAGLELYFCLLDKKHSQKAMYHDTAID